MIKYITLPKKDRNSNLKDDIFERNNHKYQT